MHDFKPALYAILWCCIALATVLYYIWKRRKFESEAANSKSVDTGDLCVRVHKTSTGYAVNGTTIITDSLTHALTWGLTIGSSKDVQVYEHHGRYYVETGNSKRRLKLVWGS